MLEPSPIPISCIVLNVWVNALMHEKKEREEKYYLKVMVPVVVGLGQALLPNQNNVMVHGTHLYWPLFYLHIYSLQYEYDHERSYHETYSFFMTGLEKLLRSHMVYTCV